jgi:hypothetical protein
MESAAPDAPRGFLRGWGGPDDVPGREGSLVEMEGRGEEGALMADGREGGREGDVREDERRRSGDEADEREKRF